MGPAIAGLRPALRRAPPRATLCTASSAYTSPRLTQRNRPPIAHPPPHAFALNSSRRALLQSAALTQHSTLNTQISPAHVRLRFSRRRVVHFRRPVHRDCSRSLERGRRHETAPRQRRSRFLSGSSTDDQASPGELEGGAGTGADPERPGDAATAAGRADGQRRRRGRVVTAGREDTHASRDAATEAAHREAMSLPLREGSPLLRLSQLTHQLRVQLSLATLPPEALQRYLSRCEYFKILGRD